MMAHGLESNANDADSVSETPATIQSSHQHPHACLRTKPNSDGLGLSSLADTNLSAWVIGYFSLCEFWSLASDRQTASKATWLFSFTRFLFNSFPA
jgi:hypothetical protein